GFGEMLSLWFLALGSETAARAAQGVVLLLGAWALSAMMGPRRRAAVLFGSALFALTPVVFVELNAAYIDVLQAVFELTCVVALVRFVETKELPWLWAASTLGGGAAGCKYLGFAVLPFLWAALVFTNLRWRRGGGGGSAPGVAAQLMALSPSA